MLQWIWFPGPWFVFDSCLVKMSKAMVREVSQLMLVHYLCWDTIYFPHHVEAKETRTLNAIVET